MGLSLDIGCEAHKNPGTLGVGRRSLRNVRIELNRELEAVKPI